MLDTRLPNKSGHKLYWQGLHGSAASLAIAELVAKGTPVLYICEQAQDIWQIEEELRFFLEDSTRIDHFPDWECLPYDRVSPLFEISARRMRCLRQLDSETAGVTIATATSLLQRLPPPSHLKQHCSSLSTGEQIDLQALRSQLIDAGYLAVDQVRSSGEFAFRGGIIDLFPGGDSAPVRLDLFDTEIESIRQFDPDSQRSGNEVSAISLVPTREIATGDGAIAQFRQQFRKLVEGNPRNSLVYQQISDGNFIQGSEYYLPLFFDQTSSLMQYLSTSHLVVLEQGIEATLEKYWVEIDSRHENAKNNLEWPPLAPKHLYFSIPEWFQQLNQFQRIELDEMSMKEKHAHQFSTQAITRFHVNPHQTEPYADFIAYLNNSSHRILLITESEGRLQALDSITREHQLVAERVDSWNAFLHSKKDLCLAIAGFDRGLNLTQMQIELICEQQLFAATQSKGRTHRNKRRDPDTIIRSLAELRIDDPVVHEDHGVGRYRGLQTLNAGNQENEFAVVEYYGGDRVYIPVLSLDLVSRYIGGNSENAPLHKMGSDSWNRVRSKAKEKAYDVAAELLEVQSARLARKGIAFNYDSASYASFCAGFEYQETPHQQEAINDMLGDMTSEQPMDRLVCGDVGFGKTEIALRSAFVCVDSGRQVVILVPTTLLAQQHYELFADRFANWPVKVALFSRFRSNKELQQDIDGLKDGTIDIAIGTHKLLQKEIKFRRLGLMIIDEEHRFGVRQKEQLKRLRSQVDIITLTATPIPRTLNFALSGLRDISIIATPPKARLSVKTYVRTWDDNLIREAISRELHRGGQVYFLHNQVRTIEAQREKLQQLVPDARIEVGHGQMPERQLEKIMRAFYHQRFNVLLCSTIIESGIDIASANTIIINKANTFGMAQLHQLRGRVGRSHHQAYAYLITPELHTLTTEARQRLTAIEALDTLGAGFALASQDLEIRGAGELLGEAQSGTIDQIGFSMFRNYLQQAIADLDQNSAHKDAATVDSSKAEIDLFISARFPEIYIPDVHLRLNMYKKLASCRSLEEIKSFQLELLDRFGLFDQMVRHLIDLAKITVLATKIDIRILQLGPGGGKLVFTENPRVELEKVTQLISSHADTYRLGGPETLLIEAKLDDAEERIAFTIDLLNQLGAG